MNKEIKINLDLFSPKKPKTKRSDLKKNLMETLSKEPNVIADLTEAPEPYKAIDVLKDVVPEPVIETYGCLKNGNKPTFRQLKCKSKTVKQYAAFGKTKDVVRVIIKDKETYDKIAKDKKKLEKHSMSDIRKYLRTRRLYKVGSSAPDEVLREIYKNAYLTGNVENNSSDALVHNYLNDET